MDYGRLTGQGIAQGGSAGRAQDYANAAVPAIEKPRLSQQLDQLEKVLAECHQLAGSVESAANRILGPVPEDGAKTTGRPPSSSLEQRFAEVINVAEGLQHRLACCATRLNQAV